jgi:hypothetical protein
VEFDVGSVHPASIHNEIGEVACWRLGWQDRLEARIRHRGKCVDDAEERRCLLRKPVLWRDAIDSVRAERSHRLGQAIEALPAVPAMMNAAWLTTSGITRIDLARFQLVEATVE